MRHCAFVLAGFLFSLIVTATEAEKGVNKYETAEDTACSLLEENWEMMAKC